MKVNGKAFHRVRSAKEKTLCIFLKYYLHKNSDDSVTILAVWKTLYMNVEKQVEKSLQ